MFLLVRKYSKRRFVAVLRITDKYTSKIFSKAFKFFVRVSCVFMLHEILISCVELKRIIAAFDNYKLF